MRAMCRRRADRVIENLALRQQVTALKKERPPLAEISHIRPRLDLRCRRGRVHCNRAMGTTPIRTSFRRTQPHKLPSRASRARRGPRRAASRPAREDIYQLLPRGPLPLGSRQRHSGRETGHATTVTHGEGSGVAESARPSPSLRVAGSSMISGLIDSADRFKPLRTNNENRQGEITDRVSLDSRINSVP